MPLTVVCPPLQMTKRMLKTLETTRFAGCPVIPVAAKPGGPEVKYDIVSVYKVHSMPVQLKLLTQRMRLIGY